MMHGLRRQPVFDTSRCTSCRTGQFGLQRAIPALWTTHRPGRNKGFTLIELLVALAIVSLVALLSWQGLDNVIRLTQRVRQQDDQWEQIRAVFSQLEKDLRFVHNPRTGSNTPPTAPQNPAGGPGSSTPAREAPPQPSPTDGRQRAADRTDVIVENDNALDAVVNTVLANTRRVQIRNGALELITHPSGLAEGPVALQVRWLFANGQLRREQVSVASMMGGAPDAELIARQRNPGLSALFEEPGLRVRGVGLKVWIEGRGWDNEQYLGDLLPPQIVQSSGAGQTGPGGQGSTGSGSGPVTGNPGSAGVAGATGAIRIKGVQVRLWLPSGDIYTRVFMLGQES